ncbi:MAG TPA: helical backbone metal receptor [Puia sp.]|nr:helical backbone metal receptor [Puia sp.]
MPLFTDQLGRTISLDRPPRRIISLVPSQTELLHTLGLEEEVIGITKFCVHPQQWFRHKTRVGGTKDIRPEVIHSLQPDLIIANKEENDRAQVEQLFPHYPVWISNVATLADALQMIRSVGDLTGKTAPALSLAEEITRRFAALGFPAPSPRTAYFIWRFERPAFRSRRMDVNASVRHISEDSTRAVTSWMVAGGDTFIQDMLTHAGFINIFQDLPRYPVIGLESLAGSGCELVLLSSEPYPFREKHIGEIRAILPKARVLLVDGEIFSWYGSRLLQAPAYFLQIQDSLLPRFRYP